MKLAIVRQKYTPFGGAERFVERAIGALLAQGVDVEIIAREWKAPSTEAGAHPPVLRLNPIYAGRTWRDASFALAVQRIMLSGKYDVVQSHERIPGCHIYRAGDGVHATWLDLRTAAPTSHASMVRAGQFLSPWHNYVLGAEAAMFHHPDLRAVICNSRMVRDDIARRFELAADKLHVIYNGVDLQQFHPNLRNEHYFEQRRKLGADGTADFARPVMLFVGSGYRRKGLPTLLNAMSAMQRGDVQLWVVGRDKEEAAMRRLAQKLGIDHRVYFCGPQSDVRPFYAAANLFVLPTVYDPLPNAALEALACGLPVVTTPACGVAELLTPACGRVVAAHDASALAQSLDELCIDGQADAMHRAARRSVEHLDLNGMAQKMLDIYKGLS